jgi:hypothetical protein
MRDGDSTFDPHFRKTAIRELIGDLPTHAQEDEFLLEVAAPEQRIRVTWRSHDWIVTSWR